MDFRKANKIREEQRGIKPRFIYLIAMGVFYITTLIGITPFIYEPKPKCLRQHQVQAFRLQRLQSHQFQFRVSRALQWYSRALLLLITASIPFALHVLYNEMHFLTLTRLLAFIGNLRYVLIQGLVIVLICINCCQQRRLLRFLNRWAHLQRPLLKLKDYLRITNAEAASLHRLDLKSCILLCAKLVNVVLPLVWTEYVVRKERAAQRPALLASLIFNCCCVMILQVLVALYYICALKIAHYAKQINTLLQCALTEVKEHLEQLRPLNANARYRILCLCTVISRLQRLYKKNTEIGQELVAIYNPTLLAFICYAIVMCTVQLFVFYFLTCSHKAGIFKTDGTLTHKDRCSSPNFVGVVQVLIMFIDIYILMWGTYLIQAGFSATSIIVAECSTCLPLRRRICSRRCCETQLETVLEDFALYLRMDHQQQHRSGRRYACIMICGLFAMERRLIFLILQTIINYLLILIQYDKVT